MLVTTLPLPAAKAANGSNLNGLLGSARADSLAATEDALWMLYGNQLWRWQPGQPEAGLVAPQVRNAFQDPDGPQALGHLMAYENRLYSFHPALGTVSAVEMDGRVQLKDIIQWRTDGNDACRGCPC